MPGLKEKSFTQLQEDVERRHLEGEPAHAEILQMHQMISFPVACLVFALLGLALGLSTRKEGRLAGLTLGLGVVLAYYAVMALAETWTKSVARNNGPVDLVASWARWIPNIVLGLVGILALLRHARPPGKHVWQIPMPAWLTRGRGAAHLNAAGSAKGAYVAPVVVLVRMRRMSVPLPRLLDRYISKR